MVLSIYDPKNAHFGACSLFHIRGTLDVDGVAWNSPADYIYRGIFPRDSPENASLLTLEKQTDLSKKFEETFNSYERSLVKKSVDHNRSQHSFYMHRQCEKIKKHDH